MRNRLLTVPLTVLGILLLAGCGSQAPAESTPPTDGGSSPACEYEAGGTAAREVTAPEGAIAGSSTTATLQTSAGDIAIILDAERTPCTTGSFLSLAGQSYFDDTPCHRLTTSDIFVLQCGDPTGTGTGGPGYRYADELDGSETYPAGTVAMANSGPDTNGSQFFLVYKDTPLPPKYTVFGNMDAEGLAVVQAIAAQGAAGTAPATPVTITGVTVD